ncbi:MAG: FHA domain-containing protein [Planctomycetota bacterium]
MLRPRQIETGNVETMTARLVLAVGSHAGLEAPLQNGYYMIGRHSECQIRPKSRSVSRRHCLLFAQKGELQVRDLGSASGTKVNDRRMEGNLWFPLRDGDELRCGKVVFQVSMTPANVEDGEALGMVTAEPWQSFDVASMLSSADEEEREKRYDQIRGGGASSGRDNVADIEFDSEDTQIELDDFAEAFVDDYPMETPVQGGVRSEPQRTSVSSKSESGSGSSPSKQTLKPGKPKPGKPKASKPKKPPKPSKKSRKTMAGSKKKMSGVSAASADRLKLAGVTVLVVAMVGFFGYRVYQFTAGPSVRVIQNID